MHDSFVAVGLVALTVMATIVVRSRGLATKMAVEAVLIVAIGGFLMWEGSSPLPHLGRVPAGFAGSWIRTLAVVWWLVGARLVVNLTMFARGRDPKSRNAQLFSDLIAGVIYIAACLIILNSVLDFNVTGLLATSGVLAIILGLALQNTLADVFSGIAVGLERPFRVGDRVSLGDNLEGVVVQMNWRSIRIHTDGDDLATIPNSIVAKAHLINRSVPTERRSASVEIITPGDALPPTVLELVRQATLLCPTILPVPAPTISIARSGLVSNAYNVNFSVPNTPALATAKSNLLRQTRRMFRHAGIAGRPHLSPVELLSSLVLFEALAADELQSLAGSLIDRPIDAGDLIFEQGAAASSIFVVQAGVLELSRRHAGSDAEPLGRIGPGEYIGELGLITASPRAYTLTALTHGRVLELPGASLIALLKSNSALNSAMERCVRRGLDMIERDDAARVVQAAGQPPDLFARIKAFFHVKAS